jgi:uncharacterized protein YecE (DUF72 family)
MDFGRIHNVNAVRFELPPEDSRTTQLLENRRGSGQAQVFVGCPVWGQKRWVGTLYPEGTQAKDYLKFYGVQFNTIELNSTFYGNPDAETAKRWREQVPEDFQFCPKLHQDASHGDQLTTSIQMARFSAESLRALGPALGHAFLQLPPHLGPERLGALEKILLAIPRDFPMAVEFRHSDWFGNRGQLVDEAYDLLAGLGTSLDEGMSFTQR